MKKSKFVQAQTRREQQRRMIERVRTLEMPVTAALLATMENLMLVRTQELLDELVQQGKLTREHNGTTYVYEVPAEWSRSLASEWSDLGLPAQKVLRKLAVARRPLLVTPLGVTVVAGLVDAGYAEERSGGDRVALTQSGLDVLEAGEPRGLPEEDDAGRLVEDQQLDLVLRLARDAANAASDTPLLHGMIRRLDTELRRLKEMRRLDAMSSSSS